MKCPYLMQDHKDYLMSIRSMPQHRTHILDQRQKKPRCVKLMSTVDTTPAVTDARPDNALTKATFSPKDTPHAFAEQTGSKPQKIVPNDRLHSRGTLGAPAW